MQHLVTMFDRSHLARGIACLRSYLRCGGEHAFALCLEDGIAEKLPAGTEPLKLTDVEARWPGIAKTQASRTRRGYICSLKPFLIEMALDKVAGCDDVLYADSDIFFFRDPRSIRSDAPLAAVRLPVALAARIRIRFGGGVVLCKMSGRELAQLWQQRLEVQCCEEDNYDEDVLSFVADDIPTPGVNVARWADYGGDVICYHFSEPAPDVSNPPAPVRLALRAEYEAALEEARQCSI